MGAHLTCGRGFLVPISFLSAGEGAWCAMRRPALLSSRLRAALGTAHPVDRSLLLFMTVLLAQAVYTLFFPASGQAAGDIDIVVRTSSAAIFGYFLGANFIRHTTQSGQAQTVGQGHSLETGGEPSAAGPVARIGFDTGAAQADQGGIAIQAASSPSENATAGCLQIRVATVIGLACLIALLVLRNLSQWGLLPVQWEEISVTAAQLRDFVSGCVGFLIGSPTQTAAPSDPA